MICGLIILGVVISKFKNWKFIKKLKSDDLHVKNIIDVIANLNLNN